MKRRLVTHTKCVSYTLMTCLVLAFKHPVVLSDLGVEPWWRPCDLAELIALHLEKQFYESCYITEILYHNESGSCRRVYRTVPAA
jgi:hypothetical protein